MAVRIAQPWDGDELVPAGACEEAAAVCGGGPAARPRRSRPRVQAAPFEASFLPVPGEHDDAHVPRPSECRDGLSLPHRPGRVGRRDGRTVENARRVEQRHRRAALALDGARADDDCPEPIAHEYVVCTESAIRPDKAASPARGPQLFRWTS